MKLTRLLAFLPLLALLALLVGSANAASPRRIGGPREGTYTFDFNFIAKMAGTIRLSEAPNGEFTVSGSMHSPELPKMKPFAISGILNAKGQMRAKARPVGAKDGGSPLDGHWDPEKNTLVLTRFEGHADEIDCVRVPDTTSPPKTGRTYASERYGIQIILSKSSNPDQLSVTGRSGEVYGVVVELRGTYYVKRRTLSMFGEVRGREELETVKVDGPFSEGVFKVKYVADRPDIGKTVHNESVDVSYEGKAALDPRRGSTDPTTTPERKNDPATKPSPKGSIKGSIKMDRGSADVGENLKLTLVYGLNGRTEADVTESVALYGPEGTVQVRSDKTRTLTDSQSTRTFNIKCAKNGAYKVKVRVKGDDTDEWTDSTSFSINKGAEKPEKTADFSGEWSTDAGTMVLTQGGNSVQGTYTWMSGTIEGTVTGRKLKFKWSQPKNDRYGTGEFTMAAGGNSFSGSHVYTHPADAASLPAKPWGGSRTKPGTKTEEPEEEKPEAPVSTTLTPTSPDEEQKKIAARVEPAAITLRAGEPSKIVNITISGFRTNTADRVEVLFPQATDGWASLPGQIVVGGGAGSYDPANMGRPEHADGYFFSARSTAPGGTTPITIVVRQKGAGEVRLKIVVTVEPKEEDGGAASPGSSSWTGKWTTYTSFGIPPMILTQTGKEITGTFADGKGTIKGTVDGKVFKFTFVDGRFDIKAHGEFTMSDDGTTFEGKYVDDDDKEKIPMFVQGTRLG